MPARASSVFRAMIGVILVCVLFALPGCFRAVHSDSGEVSTSPTPSGEQTLPPTPGPWTGVQFKFLWMVEGANPGERFGSSLALLGDVDGDGGPDIAVGATAASPSNRKNAGSVYVISLKICQALYRLDGQYEDDQFGRTLAAIGDLNGDGITDFVVGAPLGDVQGLRDAGYAMIYSGSDGKMLDYYTGVASGFGLGHSAAGLGDVNKDGYPDFALGTPYASQSGNENAGAVIIEVSKNQALNRSQILVSGEAAGDNFGWSIAGIGDVNRDGVPDLAVGAPGVRAPSGVKTGRVYLLSGRDGTVIYKIEGKQAGNDFGFAVAGIDDVNGDNVPDVVVGAPQISPTRTGAASQGKAYVFSGQDGKLVFELTGSPPGNLFGYSVSSGDFNADGRSDIIVGDPGTYGNHGSVHVFSGRDGNRYFIFTNNPNRKEEIGFSLAPAKDLNGDGRGEIVMGAAGAPSIEGKPTGRLYVLTSRP